jgi:hypothetical protein
LFMLSLQEVDNRPAEQWPGQFVAQSETPASRLNRLKRLSSPPFHPPLASGRTFPEPTGARLTCQKKSPNFLNSLGDVICRAVFSFFQLTLPPFLL